MYEYRIISIAKVIDGDTLDVDLDLGFYATLRVRLRLVEIDTYEVYGKNAHPLGIEARDFAQRWLEERESSGLVVHTYALRQGTPVADGSFGRWLGDIYSGTGERLVDALREAGYAEEDA